MQKAGNNRLLCRFSDEQTVFFRRIFGILSYFFDK